MSAPSSFACVDALARRSARSMLPRSSDATGTTLNPAITALAGLVPCADIGIRHTFRCASPRDSWYGADHQQAGQLALRAGIGLQRHRREAGDLGQLEAELLEEPEVAGGLVARRERVEPVELPPAHRHHLGGGVELHRARAERDHRGREREVARLQPLDVAQHLRLRPVQVEDGMGEERAGARGATRGLPRPPRSVPRPS